MAALQEEAAAPLMLQRRITGGNSGAPGRPPGVPKTKPIVLIDEAGEEGGLACGRMLPVIWAVCTADQRNCEL